MSRPALREHVVILDEPERDFACGRAQRKVTPRRERAQLTAPDRALVFDLNDFDEAAVAPAEWDLKRLVTSAIVRGQHAQYPPKVNPAHRGAHGGRLPRRLGHHARHGRSGSLLPATGNDFHRLRAAAKAGDIDVADDPAR